MIPESDLLFLREAEKDLREYILAKDLFWPLQGQARAASEGQLPPLTLGNLALSQARLTASQLPMKQAAEFAQLSERVAQIREEWLANWRLKEEREIGARLNLWQQYLRDLRSDPRQHAPFYAREVRTRVILELLDGGQAKDEYKEQLRMLDQILRGLSQPGSFIWEAEIAAGFPRERFWFLFVGIVSH
jgi:hypothetical protein